MPATHLVFTLQFVAARPQCPCDGGLSAVGFVVLTLDWVVQMLLDFRAFHDDRAR